MTTVVLLSRAFFFARRFIGSPIDGIQFEDDKVILLEFKTATSKLSARQRMIRDQVRDGRVEFEEFRLG